MVMVLSAISSCRHRMRKAEQRWPALSKAELITSCTTCSGKAEESTIMAFCPPVSAISAMSEFSSAARRASVRLINCATSVEPVKITPRTRASAVSLAPTVSPLPGSNCSAARGIPASCSNCTARNAIKGVCSAGLASTTLPAASAALISPVKIASGKFHGLMHTTGPSASAFCAPRICSA